MAILAICSSNSPRGWHLDEPRITVDNQPISGSLFDFAIYFYHNAHELVKRGHGPYFYLPKMSTISRRGLWNDVFVFSQSFIGMQHNTIRATVLIETLPPHSRWRRSSLSSAIIRLVSTVDGMLSCSILRAELIVYFRWDYIFSFIKKRRADHSAVLPDRKDVTMTVHFMDSYVRLLIQTCHKCVVLPSPDLANTHSL